jgi:hypothetical protein
MCRNLKRVNSNVFENILYTFAWKELRKQRKFFQIANKPNKIEISTATPECKLRLYDYIILHSGEVLC